MSQQLTLELSDEVYKDLQQKADTLGLSITEWVTTVLSQQNEPAEITSMSATQQEQVRQKFMSFAGAINLGYATDVDNEEIDADLARAYSVRSLHRLASSPVNTFSLGLWPTIMTQRVGGGCASSVQP